MKRDWKIGTEIDCLHFRFFRTDNERRSDKVEANGIWAIEIRIEIKPSPSDLFAPILQSTQVTRFKATQIDFEPEIRKRKKKITLSEKEKKRVTDSNVKIWSKQMKIKFNLINWGTDYFKPKSKDSEKKKREIFVRWGKK